MEEYVIMDMFSSVPNEELKIEDIEDMFRNYIQKKEIHNNKYVLLKYDDNMVIPEQTQLLISELKSLGRKILIIQKEQMVVGVIGYKAKHTKTSG
ncbi:MAG: hypothetical protein K6E47_08035 [Lachnospiraceae bacterium]|nr:hypothetical protein [Lachnospiraceae bacterium]